MAAMSEQRPIIKPFKSRTIARVIGRLDLQG